jgi:uncharacterized membrane protein YdbT with pleckstrin-like domain
MTSTLARYLSGSEEAVMEVRRHPFSLMRTIGITLLALVGASAVGALTSWEEGSDFIDTAVGLIAIFFVMRLFWKLLIWWEDRIVVTDQRIFEVSGILTRKVASMPLEKVTDMTYRRTIGGRIFGYGDLIVETPGQKQAMDHISYLPRPDEFYRTVTSLVNSHPPPGRILMDETGPRGPDEDDTGPLPRVIL